MLVRQVALVADGVDIPIQEILRVASALQKQVTRDFAPVWKVRATVDGFAGLEEVPLGYWPVIIVKDVQGAAGFHTDKNGQPFSLVEMGSSWSLTASHEVLEVLVDPFGSRLVAGPSPMPDQGRVEFLVEVCDPSKKDGVQYSFNGKISEPREVPRGGYLSWHDPVTDHWFQKVFFAAKPAFRDLGVLARKDRSLREMIDALTPETNRLSTLEAATPRLADAITAAASSGTASTAWAESLRARIGDLPRG
jgi:hypothetical protein